MDRDESKELTNSNSASTTNRFNSNRLPINPTDHREYLVGAKMVYLQEDQGKAEKVKEIGETAVDRLGDQVIEVMINLTMHQTSTICTIR